MRWQQWYLLYQGNIGSWLYNHKKPVIVTMNTGSTPGMRYPAVSAAPNTPLQLTARDLGIGYTYQWYPPVGINFSDIKNPTFNYNQQTEFTITLTPPDGSCPTVDTLLVQTWRKPRPQP
jgi:hypothetical protein